MGRFQSFSPGVVICHCQKKVSLIGRILVHTAAAGPKVVKPGMF